MQIPRKVKIASHFYKVTIEPMMNAWHNSLGVSWISQNEIKIDSEIPQDQKEETFLHEVFHILIDPIHEQLPKEVKESLVKLLGRTFYSFVKENPQVFQNDSLHRNKIRQKSQRMVRISPPTDQKRVKKL